MYRTAYRTVDVNGLSVFYREAGPQDAPAILLLHGFPSSSRMWQPLLDRLADRFRLVAPDYPRVPGTAMRPATRSSRTPSTTWPRSSAIFTRPGESSGPTATTHEAALRERLLLLRWRRGSVTSEPARTRRLHTTPDLWTDEFAFLEQAGCSSWTSQPVAVTLIAILHARPMFDDTAPTSRADARAAWQRLAGSANAGPLLQSRVGASTTPRPGRCRRLDGIPQGRGAGSPRCTYLDAGHGSRRRLSSPT